MGISHRRGDQGGLSDFAPQRAQMVARQIAGRGITDERVLAAMRTVPREAFVAPNLADYAYEDSPLPIAEGQTISQPYIVAMMAQAAEPAPGQRVLEIGTGSGYGAAVISRIATHVYSIDRHQSLIDHAAEALDRLGYGNIDLRVGDGTLGWPEAAPFDAIIVTAGGPDIPQTLLDQLAPGGRLVIPVGDRHMHQELVRVRKQDGGFVREALGAVRFVPLIGSHGW
ncbi:MAG: protein-L-isoaspartate(D-aspartate) O-methyltransferase [Rhodothalassiaceae bacterium]